MEDENQRSNMGLFGVTKIPTDDQIRNYLDLIDNKHFNKLPFEILKFIIDQGKLENFHVLVSNPYEENKSKDSEKIPHLVVALDGTRIFSSNKICCDSCIKKEHRNGEIEFIHNAVLFSIVTPNSNKVIPLTAEFNEKNE
jgi:hypothetical protein